MRCYTTVEFRKCIRQSSKKAAATVYHGGLDGAKAKTADTPSISLISEVEKSVAGQNKSNRGTHSVTWNETFDDGDEELQVRNCEDTLSIAVWNKWLVTVAVLQPVAVWDNRPHSGTTKCCVEQPSVMWNNCWVEQPQITAWSNRLLCAANDCCVEQPNASWNH